MDAADDTGDIEFVEGLGVTPVAAIVIICLLVGKGVKVSPLGDEAIPVIVGAVGGVLGVIGLYVIPDFPAADILTAVAVGIASGLAATGIHQAAKQITKLKSSRGV